MFFFFFKQKTAYDMRISDWSSDVCSSDLDPMELNAFAAGSDEGGCEGVQLHRIVTRRPAVSARSAPRPKGALGRRHNTGIFGVATAAAVGLSACFARHSP